MRNISSGTKAPHRKQKNQGNRSKICSFCNRRADTPAPECTEGINLCNFPERVPFGDNGHINSHEGVHIIEERIITTDI